MKRTAKSNISVCEIDNQHMAEITGDTNPVHVDEEFARKTRFGGCISHEVFC
ncbi:MAG: acyl dehydratase, partial [Proteobacteria bacterium]|nr:acyl dehydratase [Pseudomonadota bacterium]